MMQDNGGFTVTCGTDDDNVWIFRGPDGKDVRHTAVTAGEHDGPPGEQPVFALAGRYFRLAFSRLVALTPAETDRVNAAVAHFAGAPSGAVNPSNARSFLDSWQSAR
jgi:hypothetical protein